MGMGYLGAWQCHWTWRLIQLSFSLFSPSLSLLLHLSIVFFNPVSIDFTMVARPSHHSAIRRLFPQTQIQTVPNAGHWVHSDKPQDFMDAVISFLA